MTEDLTLITVTKQCPLCQQTYGAGAAVCAQDGTLLLPVRKDALINTLFADKYRITSEIGRGGMSIVYKGVHEYMRREVAIKIMQNEISANPTSVRRFQQESEAASRLSHPHVITVYDFGVTPNAQPYMVLDLVHGTNFSDVIKKEGRLSVARVLHIFDQICDALEHAHQRSVVHRDLKPSNIMLVSTESEPDFVKVLDFGIAKLLEPLGESETSLTTSGEVFGSPLYMSPEQCKAEASDQRTDIYAIGVMLYEALTGRLPICGRNYIETLQMQIASPAPSFGSVCPDAEFPRGLEEIVFKAIQKNPDDRYQSVHDLRQSLKNVGTNKAIAPGGAAGAAQIVPLRKEIAIAPETNGDPNFLKKIIAALLIFAVSAVCITMALHHKENSLATGAGTIAPIESATGSIYYFNPNTNPGVLVLNCPDGLKSFALDKEAESYLKSSDEAVYNSATWKVGFHNSSGGAVLDEEGTTYLKKSDKDIQAVDRLIRGHYSDLANGRLDEAWNDFSKEFVHISPSKARTFADWKNWHGVPGCENAPVSSIQFLPSTGFMIIARVDASQFVKGEEHDYFMGFVKEKGQWKIQSLSLRDRSPDEKKAGAK